MADRDPILWRFVLCDLMGAAIASLSPISSEKQLAYALNRSSRLSFSCPSDNPLVGTLHTDGDPYLTVGNRTIKGFRRTGSETTWTCRFNGIVWDLQDVGDGDACRTAVTAYDPFKLLERRLVLSSAGKVYKTVEFVGTDLNGVRGDHIARDMVDRTISFVGPCGLETNSFTLAAKQYKKYDQAYIAPAIVELCDTGLLDIELDPEDRTDGILCLFNAMPRRGQDRPNVIISYAAPGRTAYYLDRTLSMDTVANDIRVWGGSTTGHLAHVTDATSKTKYHAYQDATVLTEVKGGTDIDNLAAELLALRKNPRDMLTVLPTPGLAPTPFTQYFLGDTVTVLASVGSDQSPPQTRERLMGMQRVYGISIDVDDNGVERVAGLDLSPQGI